MTSANIVSSIAEFYKSIYLMRFTLIIFEILQRSIFAAHQMPALSK